jgi:hypothetical protein
MNDADIQLLKSSVDKSLKLCCVDGEVLVAKIIYVWDEYGDVSFDVISTNRPEKYEKYPAEAAYTINLQDIASVEAISNNNQAFPKKE